jgi:hypothetical protein
MSKAWDDNAEIRAMILSSLPFPPLPVRCCAMEENSDLLTNDKIITSHDILSKLLEETSFIKDDTVHHKRRLRQQEVWKCVMSELFALERDHEVQPPELYSLYCKSTIAYIDTFFPETATSRVEMLNLNCIQDGDNVHKKMCDYMAGQAIILGLEPSTQKAYTGFPYHQLMLQAKHRLITESPQSESETVEHCSPESGLGKNCPSENDPI